jgi:UDP-N-acetylmuramate--alanine ligase
MMRALSARPDIDLIALARTGTVHFVGIGGAGMSVLAEMLLRAGGSVSGCDAHTGVTIEALRTLGAHIDLGHGAEHVQSAVAVVATAAVPNAHPELEAARERGIPVLKRAAALGAIVNHGTVVAIAGTHGKTTTTAMTTAILTQAGLDPTGLVGGVVPGWGSGLRSGSDRLFVVEADEYDRSFLTLDPTIAVVTSVEADHLDIYGTLDAIEEAFRAFLAPVPPTGLVAICVDDPGAAALLPRVRGPRTVSYGTGQEASLRAMSVSVEQGGTVVDVTSSGQALGELFLNVPGMHNVRNALGAFAAARHLGATFEHARGGLAGFKGVTRRFEVLGEAGRITVVDDYAHHPTEIDATLTAARRMYPTARIVAAFQPHLYSRTRDFAEAFGRALATADVVWITNVFAAREQPIAGITGQMIVDATRSAGASAVNYHEDIATLVEALLPVLAAGDVALFMGAGNIDGAARAAFSRLMEGR